MYYEVAVKFDKAIEGTSDSKPVTEVYLFEAVSYTDAETTATQVLKEIISGEFEIVKIAQFKIQTVLNESAGGMFYLAGMTYLVEQEDGNFKKQRFKVLVNAADITAALTFLNDHFHDSVDETYTSTLAESKILELFRPDKDLASVLKRGLKKVLKDVEFEVSVS